MIRAVALDLMDTVVTDPFREALRAATGLPLRELLARRDPAVYPAFERGEISEQEYWDHHRRIGVDADPEVFHRVRRARTRWVPGMRELLDELDGVVLRVAASNYPTWIDDLVAERLDGRFDRVVASVHLGVRKPDPGFYLALLDELGLPADAVLFVDDRQDNVDGARHVGLAAHRFEDVAGLRRWLVAHGVPVTPDGA